MDFNEFLKDSLQHNAVASVVVLVVVVLLRFVLRRAVLRNVAQPELRLKWLVNIRNGLLIGFVLGLGSIWAEALRPFAVSVVALAVAFVIATKELIQCVSGSVVRATGKFYSIGDRIEIGGYRGDVIDQSLLSTTILEVGPGRAFHMYTGRTVTFPNSLLLTAPVLNESSTDRYIVHAFTIPLRADEDWKRAEAILLEAAGAECEPFLEEAKSQMEALERTYGFGSPSAEPRVAVQISDPGSIRLMLRIPCLVGRQGRLEQAILRRFLGKFHGESEPGKD